MKPYLWLVAVTAILVASLSGFVVTAIEISTAGYMYVIPDRMPPHFYILSVINWIFLCVLLTSVLLFLPLAMHAYKNRENNYV